MPQLDIYLLNTFVWSMLGFFILLYFLNILYVNANLFLVINLRVLKNIVDKIFIFFSLNNYNKIKNGKVLVTFLNLNKNNLLIIKTRVITNNFMNLSSYFCNLYNFFNINTSEINKFILLNIELSRIC